MRRKILNFAAAFSVLLLAFAYGCEKDGVSTSQTNNTQVQVTLLFEHDGCKVYRFWDNGEPVYYADCRGGNSQSTSVDWNQLRGKVTVPVQVVTAEGK